MIVDIEMSKQVRAGMAALVEDGEWHPFWQFLPILECVPPERATRVFLYSKGKPDKPLDEQISRGRREILRQRLANLVRRGTWESKGDGFDREYRLTPKVKEVIPELAPDVIEEAIKAGEVVMDLPSTKHFSGGDLKVYLAHVAQLLLIKATKV